MSTLKVREFAIFVPVQYFIENDLVLVELAPQAGMEHNYTRPPDCLTKPFEHISVVDCPFQTPQNLVINVKPIKEVHVNQLVVSLHLA